MDTEDTKAGAAGNANPKRPVFHIGKKEVRLVPKTARWYYDTVKQARPVDCDEDVAEEYFFWDKIARWGFGLPQLYVTLKALFGESTTTYDEWKESFGYPFQMRISQDGAEDVLYAMRFSDYGGVPRFGFYKVSPLEKPEPGTGFRTDPVESQFSGEESDQFKRRFIEDLVEYGKAHERELKSCPDFARTQYRSVAIYGVRDGEFFVDNYSDTEGVYDEFEVAVMRIRDLGIPLDRTRPNHEDTEPEGYLDP